MFLIVISSINSIPFKVDFILFTSGELYFLLKYLYIIITINAYFSAILFKKIKFQNLYIKKCLIS